MELFCIENGCGVAIQRTGTRGPIPKYCAEHRRLRKNASRRTRYWQNPEAAIAAAAAWNAANPERKKANAAAWYERNRESLIARRQEWAKSNPGRDWVAYIWRKYNLTLDRYMEMFAEQGGECAIPSCREVEGRPGIPLYVDHDHACCPGDKSCGTCVRWLLCHQHNMMFGNAGDDPVILEEAAALMRSYRLAVAS